jgi:putative ABC transport system ATP-binding protein
MQPIIHLDKIIKNYYLGKQVITVLKQISLEVYKNEYIALMGPSGSGKSTLMNIIGCLDTPTSGSYLLNGKDVSRMSDNELADVRNQEIGFVFQQFNLLPRLTAVENVALPLVYAGVSKKLRLEKAMHVLEKVSLVEARTSG